MNINYETGNVIRNTVDDFSEFTFPAILPTEEWGGGEVRSYANYIRPVANLFENDRENNGFIKDIYKSIDPKNNEYAVISGCNVEQVNYYYYEVQHGAFISNGKIYYIFPACEAVSKQLESEFQQAGLGDLKLKITYDYETGAYSYKYSMNAASPVTGSANNAVSLMSTLLTAFGLESSIESHIILPIFRIETNETKSIFFNGSVQASSEPVPANSVLFATATNGTLDNSVKTYTTTDGTRIAASSVSNSSLENHGMTFGVTNVNLGETEDEFSGIKTINGIHFGVDNNKMYVNYSSLASGANNATIICGISADADYDLKDACTHEVTANDALPNIDDDKLPTASAVKAYIADQINGQTRSSHIDFANGITVSNGVSDFNNDIDLSSSAKLVIYNQADASRASSSLSSAASIYTMGGIEAEKNIYSNGNIVGLNSGTYSSRKLKENITPFKKSATKLINGVKIVNYNYIADAEKNHKVGFIADDTDELLATKNHNIMDQSNCIGVLMKAVQELSADIKKLKEEIDGLKNISSGK